MEFLAGLDTHFFIAMHTLAHNAFADRFVMIFTGRYTWVPLYLALIWLLWRTYGTKKAIIFTLTIILSVTLADQICATFIRPMVERLRPANIHNPLSALVHVVDGYRGGKYGFPSCHAANTFALATYILLLTRNYRISTCIYIWAMLNCYTRLYLGVHYPGDLLVGAAIGGLIALIICVVTQHFLPVDKLQSDKNFYPGYIVVALIVIVALLYAAIW